MKRRVPEGGESVLFDASLEIVHVTIPTGQGEIDHVDENAFIQILHSSGNSWSDTLVKIIRQSSTPAAS